MRCFPCPIILLVLAAVGCVGLCAIAHGAPNWPMFLENPAHTPTPQFQPEKGLGVAWTAWCKGVFGSPVVHDGIVYFAGRDGCLYAVDDATGRALWHVEVSAPGQEIRETENAPDPNSGRRFERGILATPAIGGERVYVGGLDGRFHARDAVSGELVWQEELGEAVTSSPVLCEALVVVGTRGGRLVAMDAETGAITWSHEAGGEINSSPAFADGKIVVGTAKGVIAVAAESGALLWRHQFLDGGKCDASPCIAADRVYAASWAGAVCSLNLADGEPVWERNIMPEPIFASPAVAGELVYVATTAGTVAALETDTGRAVWDIALPAYGRRPPGVYASPVVCGPVLLVGCNEGRVHVLDMQTGEPVNELRRDMYPYVHGAPVVTDDALYVASEHGPLNRQGRVTKLSTETTQLRAQPHDFPGMACLELGIPGFEQPADVLEYGGWALPVQSTHQVDDLALAELANLGLIRSPSAWRRGRLDPFQLAAFYYNLFWDPNPFGVRLPEFEPAELLDARQFPTWIRNGPQLVVGLGLIDAPGAKFDGHRAMTVAEVRVSLQRARKLLDELPRLE